MPVPIDTATEEARHRDRNHDRVAQLIDQQWNMETTHPFLLRFVAADHEDAVGLGRLLFAKGMRMVTPEPRHEADGWHVEVAVKRNLREITTESFTCDLIKLAGGVRALYESWNFLNEEPAEQVQQHSDAPDPQ